jgi:hypothetical protein
MTATITINLQDQAYERRLRALAAWWCLGSSALEPQLLMQYAPVPPADLRTAGF